MRLVKKSTEREVTCQHCNAVMYYESKDIRDVCDGVDCFCGVVCPECGRYVMLPLNYK